MRRRRMHQTSTGIGCDVFATDNGHFFCVKRMVEQHMLQGRTLAFAQYLPLQLIALQRSLSKISTQNQIALGGSYQRIFNRWMHTDCFIGRQCPRRCCPDDCEGRTFQMPQTECLGHLSRMACMHFKCHVNGWRMLVFVFDFRLCQSRTTIQTPVHWLQTHIKVAIRQHLA